MGLSILFQRGGTAPAETPKPGTTFDFENVLNTIPQMTEDKVLDVISMVQQALEASPENQTIRDMFDKICQAALGKDSAKIAWKIANVPNPSRAIQQRIFDMGYGHGLTNNHTADPDIVNDAILEIEHPAWFTKANLTNPHLSNEAQLHILNLTADETYKREREIFATNPNICEEAQLKLIELQKPWSYRHQHDYSVSELAKNPSITEAAQLAIIEKYAQKSQWDRPDTQALQNLCENSALTHKAQAAIIKAYQNDQDTHFKKDYQAVFDKLVNNRNLSQESQTFLADFKIKPRYKDERVYPEAYRAALSENPSKTEETTAQITEIRDARAAVADAVEDFEDFVANAAPG